MSTEHQETISKKSMNLTSIGTGVIASSPFEKEFFTMDDANTLSVSIYMIVSLLFVMSIIFAFFYGLYDAFRTGHGPMGKFGRFVLAFVHSYFYLALRVAGYM